MRSRSLKDLEHFLRDPNKRGRLEDNETGTADLHALLAPSSPCAVCTQVGLFHVMVPSDVRRLRLSYTDPQLNRNLQQSSRAGSIAMNSQLTKSKGIEKGKGPGVSRLFRTQ